MLLLRGRRPLLLSMNGEILHAITEMIDPCITHQLSVAITVTITITPIERIAWPGDGEGEGEGEGDMTAAVVVVGSSTVSMAMADRWSDLRRRETGRWPDDECD